MSEREVWERDAHEIADAVRVGNLSAREVVEAHLARIEKLDPDLNSVCYLDASGARERADAIDAEVRDGGDPGPLAGVPVGVKELASVGGWPETHASVVLADRVAVTDDNEVSRLRGAGAVITGLTTASEHGTVSFTSTPLHGVTRNPWNLECTPGGSSGGSAAAVAAGLFPACTGGDGGGSIRIPSSYSGLFGMKATFGRIGRGPGPFSSSLNPVRGPMVRSVRDAARYLDVTSGPTLTDPTSLPAPVVPFEDELRSGVAVERLRGKRVAFTSTVGFAGADPVVAEHAEDLAHTLIDVAGLELVPDVVVNLPKPGRSWAVLSTIDDMSWFVDDVEGRLDEVTEVHRLQHLSFTRLTPQVLAKAIRRRHELLTVVAATFEQVDLLLTPTTPTPAFAAEGVFAGAVDGEEVDLFALSAPFTAPFNMTGQPAASIPSGLVDGLPVALQVVAPRHLDIDCLAAGALLEEARPWPKLAPFAYER
jgi:aspartyl-tRNA(Asn)/glutamyl-tRNA(Gln) amidotransferase subunit A